MNSKDSQYPISKKIEDLYSEFISKRTYSRWIEEKKSRESWSDAVSRYMNHYFKYVPEGLVEEFNKAINLKINKQIMGSMRALWSAGKALEENSFSSYNCAYIALDNANKFSEMLYILMHGAGVGFSVERQYIQKLQEVPEELIDSNEIHIIEDSKLGWKNAFEYCITSLYSGKIPKFDFSQLRPKGARLKTFGGRSSGPEPLKQLFLFTIRIFKNAIGRKLNSLEVHDIATKIGECVVVGGARRSACISFSNLSDQRMRHAKDGHFYLENPQRALANNSVAYTEKPDAAIFMEEWLNLMRSGTGERGLFNTQAARKKADKLNRKKGDVRGNPCLEALLMSEQVCNLTEIVVRPDDSKEILMNKVRSAVLLGCLQSMETNFNNVSKDWKNNAEDERLLGVSLTGVCDSKLFRKVNDKSRQLLSELKEYAHACSIEFADLLNINHPKQVTLCKPSGTISQLVNCSSGIHPRYSDYYIRRVRVNAKDPISYLLLSKGIPCNPEVGQSWEDYTTLVYEFPMKSPRGSLTREDFTAIEQLEYWKMFNDYWCDGNPSCSIYVKPDEWIEVGNWVYKNWDSICGLSFFPYDGSVYPLAPYESISKDEYYNACKLFETISIDFNLELNQFETEDSTTGAQTLACSGGSCEL